MEQQQLDDIMLKAETLIEALPYIRDFNGKRVVVKYGGSAMLDEKLQESVIKDVALLKLVGMQPIIVHGGGKRDQQMAWLYGQGEPVCRGTPCHRRRYDGSSGDGAEQGKQTSGTDDGKAGSEGGGDQR